MRSNRKKQKSKIYSLDDAIKNAGLDQKAIYANKYNRSLNDAKGSDAEEKTIDSLGIKFRGGQAYELRTRILKNPWLNSRPASKATSWLFKIVFKTPHIFRYNKRLMAEGMLFMFEYKNPKYRGTSVLPWFDKFPLVLSLGPTSTNQGIRNIGINLHLLPPKIRIIVLCEIYSLYKKLYRYHLLMKKTGGIKIDYKNIVNKLNKYGVAFAIRMYIPSRQNQIINFPIKEWHKAIFLPSRGYEDIRSNQLIKEWKNYCKRNRIVISDNLNWQSKI